MRHHKPEERRNEQPWFSAQRKALERTLSRHKKIPATKRFQPQRLPSPYPRAGTATCWRQGALQEGAFPAGPDENKPLIPGDWTQGGMINGKDLRAGPGILEL